MNNVATTTITIALDATPPTITNITQSPLNITEHSASVTITAIVTDDNVGVNPSSVRLLYSVGAINRSIVMSGATAPVYRVTFFEDWNAQPGAEFTYRIQASDYNSNSNTSDLQIDNIDPVNDMPVVSILAPNGDVGFAYNGTLRWNITDPDNSAFTTQ